MQVGAQSSDQSLVDLYLLLSDFGESDVVHAHVPAESEILELGCGTGRMTRRLLELGHPVTCVDVSAAMLAHAPRQAERVLADIETLELGRPFPVVLLASNLVNRPDAASRRGLLESCRRHVTADGQVIIQRYSPTAEGWQDRGWIKRDRIELRVAEFERDGCEISARLEYRNDERLWSQSFSAVILEDEILEQEARAAGLCWGGVLTSDGQWVELRVGNV
ncbi:MAG: class I SAM-dependent methyltransferase [Acidimicrobiales bacterium]